MQYITDPELLKELNRGFAPPSPNSGRQSSQPTDAEKDQGWFLGEGGWGGVGEAAKQRVLSGLAHMASASTTDPEASNYSRRVGQAAARKAESEEKQLGTAGRFAAAGLQYAPAIGAGMFSPVAGAGLASGMSYGDILSEQEKMTGEYDPHKARMGAMATGAIDLASGGLGSKLTGLATRPVQRVAAEIVEDAASSAGSQVATNLASGKNWDEGYAEALLGGAAVGQGLRGLNRAGQFAVNKVGQKAVKDTSRVQSEHNVNLNPEFSDNFVEFSNASEALKQNVMSAKSSEERQQAIDALTNLSSKNAGEAAKMNAYILATDNGVGLTDAAFNYEYTRDLGRAGSRKFAGTDFNLTQEAVGRVKSLNEEARPSVLRNQKAKALGETRESHFKQVKTRGWEVLNQTMGNFTKNYSDIKARITDLEAEQKLNPWAVSDETLKKYDTLASTLKSLETSANSYIRGKDVSSEINRLSKNALELSSELGELGNLRGFDGQPGTFNPIVDVMTASHLEKMFSSEYSNFHEGTPDISKEVPGLKTTPAERATKVSAMVLAPVTAPFILAHGAAKRGSELISAGRSQKKLRKAKEKTAARGEAVKELAKQIQAKQPTVKESIVDDAVIHGEPEVAAQAAKTALAEDGITVPEPSLSKVSPEVNERLWRESGIARKPAPISEPTPEVLPEMAPEAPVTAPTVAPEVMAKPRKETPKERRKRLREERKAQRTPDTTPSEMPSEIEAIAEKRPVDISAARKPVKPVEEVVPDVVEDVTTVTERGPDLGAARKPVKPVEEVIEEKASVETPVESPSRMKAESIAKAPRKPQVEEEVKAEPTPEIKEEVAAEVATEAPKKDFVDLVSKPLKSRIAEIEALPAKDLNNKLSTELGALRAKERATERVIEDVAREEKVDADTVAKVIHEAGGIDKLGEKYKAEIKAILKKEKAEIAQAAREKAKAIKSKISEAAKEAKKAEIAEGKSEAEIARAVKKAEAEAAAARKAEEKAKLTTGFATMAQAKETLNNVAGNNPPEDVKKLIESFTRELTGSDKGPTVAQMRSAVNKVIDSLEKAKKAEIDTAKAEKARYEAWLEKGQSDFTVDEAVYKTRKDQLQQRLKKNIEQAKKDKGPRSIVQKEIERIQKEHNKEVKRLDEWLRRGDKDRVVQEAEFKQKAAELRKKVNELNAQIEEGKKVVTKVESSQEGVVQAMQKTKEATEALETAKKASEVKPKETVEDEVKRAEDAAEKEFSESTEAELKEVAKHYSSEYLDSDMSPTDLAQTAGIMKGLSKETSDDKVKAVTTELGNLFEEAAKRKAANPDNPETWITSDMFNRVKAERFGDADQSWVGSLSQNLTRAILGKGMKPSELKTESQVKKIVEEAKRLASMTPEEKAAAQLKSKARGALAAKARTKGIQQAPKKRGRLIEFVE